MGDEVSVDALPLPKENVASNAAASPRRGVDMPAPEKMSDAPLRQNGKN